MIGVLALQGGFDRHLVALEGLGVAAKAVKLPRDLSNLDGLIIPGGESTTMLRLLRAFDLFDPIKSFCASRRPVLGTCAGAILLCETVQHPSQESLAMIPASIERNAYGTQRESFFAEVDLPDWNLQHIPVYFIRAPRFVELGPDVHVLSRHNGDITAVAYQNLVAVTYHPELAQDGRFHAAWLKWAELGGVHA